MSRNAVLFTGMTYHPGCLDALYSNLIEPNDLDVYIVISLPEDDHANFRQRVLPWQSRIKLLEFIPESDIDDTALVKANEAMWTELSKYVGEENVAQLENLKSLPRAVNQFTRVADGCLRMMKHATQNGLQYGQVLRWRLDFMHDKVDLRLWSPKPKHAVSVLNRGDLFSTDAVVEFILAPWDLFLAIYLSFPRFIYHYWPAFYATSFTIPEMQFAQHLRRFRLSLYSAAVVCESVYDPKRHWRLTFQERSWKCEDALTIPGFRSDLNRSDTDLRMPSIMVMFPSDITVVTKYLPVHLASTEALPEAPTRQTDSGPAAALSVSVSTSPSASGDSASLVAALVFTLYVILVIGCMMLMYSTRSASSPTYDHAKTQRTTGR